MIEERTNLLGLTRPQLEEWVLERGGKAFRARQLWSWIYKRGETDFAQMTDLAKDFRAQLARSSPIHPGHPPRLRPALQLSRNTCRSH